MITNDSGWKVTQTGRCLVVTERWVTFDRIPTDDDVAAAWGKYHPRGQMEQADQVKGDPCTIRFYVYCDSSD